MDVLKSTESAVTAIPFFDGDLANIPAVTLAETMDASCGMLAVGLVPAGAKIDSYQLWLPRVFISGSGGEWQTNKRILIPSRRNRNRFAVDDFDRVIRVAACSTGSSLATLSLAASKAHTHKV